MATYGFDESKNKKEVYTKEETTSIIQQAIESGSTAEVDPSLAPIPEAVKEKHNMTNVAFWVGKEAEFEALGADVGYFIGRVDQNKNVYIITDDQALKSIEKELQRAAARDRDWQNLNDINDRVGTVDDLDGLLVIDSKGNIGVRIGSLDQWDNEPYNKKYGWGGHPYGTGVLPPYSKIVGILEADLLSVRGGKGRWNGDDTGNFEHGGHVFEGWNAEEDVRLTAGIGLNNKNIAFIQTFHPATESGTDNGTYYGITKIGSDIDKEGANFMPKVTQIQSPLVLWQRPTTHTPTIPQNQFDLLVDSGEVASSMAKSQDMMIVGGMYYDTTLDRVRVYSKQGWKTLAWEEEQ